MTTTGPERDAAAAPLLCARALTVRYGPLLVLDAADLTVHAGEVVALAGENGAGKSTLVRCIAGDLLPDSGSVSLAGEPLPNDPIGVARSGVAVVWQDLSLCDNLDVASNLLLGDERRFLVPESRRHARAAAMLERLHLSIDTTMSVRALSGGQRQLLAVARAVRERPRVLVLDEPTAALGAAEAGEVERLVRRLADAGTGVLLVSHDLPQVFRLADRIVVMRAGRPVAEVDPARAYPDDVIALMSGAEVDTSARHQLSRLHALVDQLTTSDRSSSLPLILSTLGAALGEDRLLIHRVVDAELWAAAAVGLPAALASAWARLPLGAAGGPVGLAAAGAEPVAGEVAPSPAWTPPPGAAAGVAGCWAVPVIEAGTTTGVITVLRGDTERPARDELELLTLYAGHVASALERERLFAEVTARNRVLETIREVLETLAGPVPVADGLALALRAVHIGLAADGVVLVSLDEDGGAPQVRGETPRRRSSRRPRSDALTPRALALLGEGHEDETLRCLPDAAPGRGVTLATCFRAPGGRAVLAAHLPDLTVPETAGPLIGDAAHCLRLALEREEIGRMHQEAAALRRSRQLQRDFLSRLSHELRTPLTAIQGYAETLRQPDVTFDADSVDRFLSRMASESARLGRLVEDLLDFSALEAGVLRLQRDWCDVALVLDAARACLVPGAAAQVALAAEALPVIWADHDRLEQVFVNLMDNAVRHNPPGTAVRVRAEGDERAVTVVVEDDGPGLPASVAAAPFEAGRRHAGASAGTGLGLSIAAAIVQAHGGTIRHDPAPAGTRFVIRLPVENAGWPLPETVDA